ncbi:hypothetical protein [Bradyrhizobium genosp. L]|uniref:hypothetical protein n=1 Tax=Bradyrhizobium genosp. L TaxID=83637 RepID=UPI001FEE9F21|nr:hypothetical protein [Bradyrhizobium genosp. L]
MDNLINEIRMKIRALRVSMLEAEDIMREQIDRERGMFRNRGRNPDHARGHEGAGPRSGGLG